ncbi:gop-2 [Pristionchus pacificus]|uniref:GPN-loop GTPase n=1 Tax=Pristionchus pacificus TaxID=54126 RepID=A0A454XQ64_PRIPA|nr:gop-2 [Pristionchus pacificus]|eukprot:PDM73151.1 gop-2 [Pristionchus pacificus]
MAESTASSSKQVPSEMPSSPLAGSSDGPNPDLAPSVIVLGMAGSGKTSFVQRLTAHLHAKKTPPYVVNLDPAVPYPVNIDIRDTVKYKQVMTEYGLGPNGAILTSLNLFCTRFDKVIELVRARSSTVPLTIIDTPGQIEAFTWSASGTIITEALASSHPTVVIYVCDSARATSPATFMSNMLYACSILYRTKLPFFVVFNKADIVRPTFAQRWMTDFERFDEALEDSRGGYSNDLARSLSLVLDEFYCGLKTVICSALTGEGMDEVLTAIDECKQQYRDQYIPLYAEMRAKKVEETAKRLREDAKMGDLTSEVKALDVGRVRDSDDENE